LKGTKEEVAIKVQRPDIQQTVEVDLEILLHLATLMERHVAELKFVHPTKIVDEFARTMEDEMDYRVEASHIERFARQFIDDRTMYVPKVFRELTTKRMLVMEFIDGIKASDFVALGKGGYDLKEVASRGADSMLQQICTWGFYHADPHPGNVLILPNNVICFIDFGMMGRISQQEREDFTDFVEVLIHKDENKAVDALLKLTDASADPKQSELQRDLMEFIDRYAYLPLKELEMGKLLQSIVEILRKHGMSLKPDLFLMVKALTISEGLGRSLDPEFEILEHAEPFFRKIRLTRYSFQGMTRDFVDTGTEWFRFVREIPVELRELLRKAREGKLKLDIEYGALEHTLFRLDLISGRIASAIVLSSLIIGSSIIVLSNTPPKWHEMPIIGLAGLFIAAVMGFWLLTSFFRRGMRSKDD
jgi:ubiquinone biosynthesis protein